MLVTNKLMPCVYGDGTEPQVGNAAGAGGILMLPLLTALNDFIGFSEMRGFVFSLR